MFPDIPAESDTAPYFQDVMVGKFQEDVDDKRQTSHCSDGGTER